MVQTNQLFIIKPMTSATSKLYQFTARPVQKEEAHVATTVLKSTAIGQNRGYATTNNPVEQFNRLIKRDYTLRAKHKIRTLFQQLADCCGHQS
ncbi:hypothetical protein F444_19708, partial [Phytophthora nicotianae P1976]